MSDSAILFLDSFDRVRFTAENRFHFMHVIILPSKNDQSEMILNHPVVQGIDLSLKNIDFELNFLHCFPQRFTKHFNNCSTTRELFI